MLDKIVESFKSLSLSDRFLIIFSVVVLAVRHDVAIIISIVVLTYFGYKLVKNLHL